MILFFLGETAATHPFFVVTLLSSIFKRRGGKGREGEALRDEKKKRLCSILFLWQMYKKRSGGLRFPAQSDKKRTKEGIR